MVVAATNLFRDPLPRPQQGTTAPRPLQQKSRLLPTPRSLRHQSRLLRVRCRVPVGRFVLDSTLALRATERCADPTLARKRRTRLGMVSLQESRLGT